MISCFSTNILAILASNESAKTMCWTSTVSVCPIRCARSSIWVMFPGTQSSSAKITWLEAVRVIPTPAAVIEPMNTRQSGSFWKRSTAAWRSASLLSPVNFTGLNSANPAISSSITSWWCAAIMILLLLSSKEFFTWSITAGTLAKAVSCRSFAISVKSTCIASRNRATAAL